MKGGKTKGSIYLRMRDPDYFRLSRSERTESGDFIAREVTGGELFQWWQAALEARGTDVLFLTACLILQESEPILRKKFRMAMQRGTPASTGAKRCHLYLSAAMTKYLPAEVDNNKQGGNNRKGKDVQDILRTITFLEKVRKKFSKQSPPRDIYPLTVSQVVDLDISDDCQQFIVRQMTARRIDSEHRQIMEEELRVQFPDDAEMVLKTLDDCRVIQEFASMSIHEIRGTLCVGIANPQGEWLRLEGYKFCQLIEEPDAPKELGSLPKRRNDHSEHALAFGNQFDSTIYAMVKASEWRLKVQAKDSDRGTAEFLLDMDHAALLSVMLRRLRHDEETYRRWQEKSLLVTTVNPFE